MALVMAEKKAHPGWSLGQAMKSAKKKYRKTGKKYENGDVQLSAEIVAQYLPSQYSTESQLRFETSAANLRAELTLQLD
jgi:uncharacterized protein YcnI